MVRDFHTDFIYGNKPDLDIDIIKPIFPNTAEVTKTGSDEDKTGIDYKVHLQNGTTINIDVKSRRNVAFVGLYPELAIETWSVMPSEQDPNHYNKQGRLGWALDPSKLTDYVLYRFDNCTECYLLPFQMLRTATIKNARTWINEKLARYTTQDNGRYTSKCLFVPANIVIQAIKQEMERAI